MQWPPTRPGRERQEIPFRSGRRQHVAGRDFKPIENDRQLVHQRDVEIALGVFDDLRRFGDFDRGRPMDAGRGRSPIHRGDPLQRFLVLSGDDFGDRLQPMLAIAGIDPLRRIAELEIHALLGDLMPSPATARRCSRVSPGIDGRFEYDDRTGPQPRADQRAGAFDRRQVGAALASIGVGTVTRKKLASISASGSSARSELRLRAARLGRPRR